MKLQRSYTGGRFRHGKVSSLHISSRLLNYQRTGDLMWWIMYSIVIIWWKYVRGVEQSLGIIQLRTGAAEKIIMIKASSLLWETELERPFENFFCAARPRARQVGIPLAAVWRATSASDTSGRGVFEKAVGRNPAPPAEFSPRSTGCSFVLPSATATATNSRVYCSNFLDCSQRGKSLRHGTRQQNNSCQCKSRRKDKTKIYNNQLEYYNKKEIENFT